jgi:hypothetical protein
LGAEAALAAGETGKTTGQRKSKSSREREERRTNGKYPALGVVTVFRLHFLFFFYIAFFDRLQLQRTGGDDFEVGATLWTRDDLALVDFFFFHIEIGFAFRTKNHDSSTPPSINPLSSFDATDNI